jgi:subtilisin-like proprotein convertase family protein
LLLAALLVLPAGLRADWVALTDTVSSGGTVPDNHPAGWSRSQTVSGLPGRIVDVRVTLNLSGGFNGDLYAYLTHESGLAILLNRSGLSGTDDSGYGDQGFSITLQDGASAGDVHWYGNSGDYAVNGSGQATGTWQPDGRYVSPLASGSAIAGASRENLLNQFAGGNPNGSWTLFVADVAAGGQSVVSSWSMGMNTTAGVPEVGSGMMGLLATGVVVWVVSRKARKQARVEKAR